MASETLEIVREGQQIYFHAPNWAPKTSSAGPRELGTQSQLEARGAPCVAEERVTRGQPCRRPRISLHSRRSRIK
jgi:hypothetical protein